MIELRGVRRHRRSTLDVSPAGIRVEELCDYTHRCYIDSCHDRSGWLSEERYPRSRKRASARPARGPLAVQPAAPRRLPGADQPALVDPGTARADRADRAGDRRGGDGADPPRLRVGRATSPGQYLRIGVVVDGVHHWRAYSLTSDPGRADGCIAITPKLVDAGKVSPYLVRRARPGDLVRLGGVEGTFVLPDPLPEKLLFISAGSGITPIMSMLRSLVRRDAVGDVVHIHSARTAESVIFGERLRRARRRPRRLRPAPAADRRAGPLAPADLDDALPRLARAPRLRLRAGGDARRPDRATGRREGDPELLAMERFQPVIGGEPGGGEGGTVRFAKSRVEADVRRRHADPRRRRRGRRDPALRLPDGDLPHLRRRAALRPGPRPAHRRGPRQRGRDGPNLRQRPRGADRDRTLRQPRGIR